MGWKKLKEGGLTVRPAPTDESMCGLPHLSSTFFEKRGHFLSATK